MNFLGEGWHLRATIRLGSAIPKVRHNGTYLTLSLTLTITLTLLTLTVTVKLTLTLLTLPTLLTLILDTFGMADRYPPYYIGYAATPYIESLPWSKYQGVVS